MDNSEDGIVELNNEDVPEVLNYNGFDLNKYISGYEGNTKLNRLLWISRCCKGLATATQRAMLSELRRGCNLKLYNKVCRASFENPDLDPSCVDPGWAEEARASFEQRVEQLQMDLSAAKAAASRETMRLKLCDLGFLYADAGNFDNALKCFLNAKEFYSLPIHQSEVLLNIIVILIDSNQFILASNHIEKAESHFGGSTAEVLIQTKLKVANAVVMLHNSRFKQTAEIFLNLDPSCCGKLNMLITSEDIAVYTSLCAVATFERIELKKLLENSKFKLFHETASSSRQFIQNFMIGQYSECLKYLREYQSIFLLDIYLSRHVSSLYTMIKNNMVCQYIAPYSCVNMIDMASSICMSIEEIEEVIMKLNTEKSIGVRIDSIHGVIRKNDLVRRDDKILEIFDIMNQSHKDLKRSVLRLSLLQHTFIVTNEDKSRVYPTSPINSLRTEEYRTRGDSMDEGGNAQLKEALSDNDMID